MVDIYVVMIPTWWESSDVLCVVIRCVLHLVLQWVTMTTPSHLNTLSKNLLQINGVVHVTTFDMCCVSNLLFTHTWKVW